MHAQPDRGPLPPRTRPNAYSYRPTNIKRGPLPPHHHQARTATAPPPSSPDRCRPATIECGPLPPTLTLQATLSD
ncbi:hypothetical protein Apa02nite_088990 [Actinoplanes palleronii]|uniref:Uncharacterized protein n=1 Tax=Actinoplanes palleronii TaxID=113570 RepID=A0ABQ4BR49_9ACTN|nr:hypothetical protein Apa02nite_088990 [Actinoplanes palleronii]